MQKQNFDIWLNQFFIDNNIPVTEKNRIHFLAFRDYGMFKHNTQKFTVFEDRWIRKPEIIKSKISAIFGVNKRIFARNCEIKKLNKETANKFINDNHIYGATASKYQLGLFNNELLKAIATFAGQRKFKTGKSAEMLRFCSKKNTTVIGGLSKLLKAYTKLYNPDDIMTYIDIDWGRGESFKKIGEGNVEEVEFEVNDNKDEVFFHQQLRQIYNEYSKDLEEKKKAHREKVKE